MIIKMMIGTRDGIKIKMKDKILFKEGSSEAVDINIRVFEKIIQLMKENNWIIFVSGHASLGEKGKDGSDALTLSSKRAIDVSRALIERGVRPEQVTTIFYGDTRPDSGYSSSGNTPQNLNRRVEFILRKVGIDTPGRKVDSK